MWDFPLFPEAASSVADRVDAIFIVMTVFFGFISVLIAVLLVYFAMKYHRSKAADHTPVHSKTWKVEIAFIAIPLVIAITIFVWSADLFFETQRAPTDTMDVYVVGKQLMWHMQHPGGQREINTLHVPVNQPIRLVMTSQDVIHSYFIPAFRLKQDVLPGRFTTMWFKATKPGRYHLFCAEYCGADHARMIGQVVVLSERDYQQWLSSGTSSATVGTAAAPRIGQSMAQTGEALFNQIGCNACHVPGDATRAPRLEGVFGREVRLANNQSVLADEHYLRESILHPNARIVAGYPQPSLMPAYADQITEEQLNELIEYIKSLSPEDTGAVRP